MKHFISFWMAVACGVFLTPGTIMARESNYPGKELNGTWEVVKWDFHGVKDMNSPEVKDFFDPLNRSANAMILPVGQKIEFWLTGESHGISPLQAPRSGMDIGMKLIFPINKDICKLPAWDYLCDENGNLNLNDEDIKKDIKDNALVVTDASQGMLNAIHSEVEELTYTRKLWPGIKNYYYELDMNGGSHFYYAYPMKDKDKLLFYSPGKGESRFGVLLKRVK